MILTPLLRDLDNSYYVLESEKLQLSVVRCNLDMHAPGKGGMLPRLPPPKNRSCTFQCKRLKPSLPLVRGMPCGTIDGILPVKASVTQCTTVGLYPEPEVVLSNISSAIKTILTPCNPVSLFARIHWTCLAVYFRKADHG